MPRSLVSLQRKSFLASLCIWVFAALPSNGMTIRTDTKTNTCTFGSIVFVFLNITFFPNDSKQLEEQDQTLASQTDGLNSIFSRICSNVNYDKLDNTLKSLIAQRVTVINRCTTAIQNHSTDQDFKNILAYTARKLDAVVEIDDLITYGTVREENARIFATKYKDMFADTGEVLQQVPELAGVGTKTLEAFSDGTSAVREMAKYITDNEIEKGQKAMVDKTDAFAFLSKKFASYYYDYYHQKNLPATLKSTECAP